MVYLLVSMDNLEKIKILNYIYKLNNNELKNVYIAKNSDSIADYLYNNMNKMNLEEKINVYKKISNETKINYELLKFELLHYEPTHKIESFEPLIKEIKHLLTRYHWRAGGFLLEDNCWNLHLKGSKKYDLLENEAIFDNSIDESNEHDTETFQFIKHLNKLFSKLSDTYNVKFKYLPDKSGIVWVLFKVSLKKLKKIN